MRQSIIAGNWKMNMTPSEAEKFIDEFLALDLDRKGEVVICPPFVDLYPLSKKLVDNPIKLGAQNVHTEDAGAFTGEVSVPMLKDLGVQYVIIGHSERREIFKESNDFINKKLLKLLSSNLVPILCLGESLEERQAGREFDLVKSQLLACLKDVDSDQVSNIVIAYEPIWAIGTGKSASSDDAETMCKFIRTEVEKLYPGQGQKIRILYGGSVKPATINELMAKENVDGALVGGASLKVEDFKELVSYEVNHD
ncbi:MAG: triose-phosphate isomerase [Bacillota bacterium]|nr:triose-phosphate isomerase [Bacillota bacterium]